MRIEPTTKALFMASDSVIVICQDANNAASLGGCVVDSAGGLLSVPFDVAFKDSKLYSECTWRWQGLPCWLSTQLAGSTGACACMPTPVCGTTGPGAGMAAAHIQHAHSAPPCPTMLSIAAVADRGVSSSSAGDGWIVRCDIGGLGTANPSLSGCTQLWGTNTAGQTGSSGNNVSRGHPSNGWAGARCRTRCAPPELRKHCEISASLSFPALACIPNRCLLPAGELRST